MEIKKTAIAGTLESSDIQITLSKNNEDGIKIILDSPVRHLFKDEMENVIIETLNSHSINNVIVKAVDKGALNCTIIARMQSAIYRATDERKMNWEVI